MLYRGTRPYRPRRPTLVHSYCSYIVPCLLSPLCLFIVYVSSGFHASNPITPAILENRGANIDLIDIAHVRFQRLSVDVYLRTVLETFRI